jgi:TolA-binding protein
VASDENEKKNSSRWLALIPVTVAVLMFLLMMPRAVPPEDIPLPQMDGVVLRAIVKDDAARAAEARKNRLPGDVLAVGSALRALNKAQAAGDTDATGSSRLLLDDALRGLGARDPAVVVDQLKTLRALQLEEFLTEVERFESTGQQSPDLLELGGGFIERMGATGWIEGHHIILDDAERRAAFKLVWTAILGMDRSEVLAVALDEQRALYTLYFTHPRPPESQRGSFQAMRRNASDDGECKTVANKERLAAELWRADKIKKLGELDPTYPTAYALGVAYYRAGRYDQSMSAFRAWLDEHPDGPLTLRARNHLNAALVANGPS